MGFRINTNVLSLAAQRNLSISSKAFGKALERLASGSRINRAGDDAAGLAISEGLGAQVRGIRVAVRNANDAVGFLNTAEGALQELTNITQRLRELAIQASNGTLGSTDRSFLDSEKGQLLEEFDRIATQTNFNGSFLLDGSFTTTDLQVGINKGETISFNIGSARSASLGKLATLSGTRHNMTAAASFTINGVVVDAAISTDDTVSSNGNSYSAIAVAKKVNAKSAETKVYADNMGTIVQVNNMSFTSYAGDLSADGLKINNVSITGTGITSVNTFISAVNNFSTTTGVKARLVSNSTDDIELVADDGRNVQLAFSGYVASDNSASLGKSFGDSANVSLAYGNVLSVALAVTSGISITRTGTVRLRSASAVTIGTGASTALGFSGTAIAVGTQAVSSISLSTQAGASDALAFLDKTLTELNTLRPNLGATQSRLDSTVTNLSITLENISSARSQIRDTDVATETAELTRAQILQQAGVAVLGQANASSQSALELLRNL